MEQPEESKILKFWTDHGIGRAIKEITDRKHIAVESFLIELLRRPEFYHCKPDDIELVIKVNTERPHEVVMTYGIKLHGKTR